ncbi:MAG: PilC/PilY family type IV pilus protein [Pseudomonadota bacterium]
MKTINMLGLFAAVACVQWKSVADDTDIYLNATPSNAAEPLVMLTLDYRSNLGSNLCTEVSPQDPSGSCGTLLGEAYSYLDTGPGTVTLFDGMRAAFSALFDELDGVKVGFMMNHANSCTGGTTSGPSKTGCSNGAYVLQGFQSFDSSDSNGAKEALMDKLWAIPTPGGSLNHSYQGKELYFELFRYLTGQGIYNGHLGWADFGTGTASNLNVDYPAISWDTTIESGANYVTPFDDELDYACSQNFAINVMFQVSNQEDNSDAAMKLAATSGGLGITARNFTFPEVIELMYDTDIASGQNGWPNIDGDQNLTSYFVAAQVNNTTNGYASAGGTAGAIALSNPGVFLSDMRSIFRQILATSTTFVAASVPVNVFNRSDLVDNVFLAQFSVDADGRPRWSGNLKKLKIQESIDEMGSTSLTLVDANATSAIATDGRIEHGALTFWTDADELPAADVDEDEVDGADGRAIERGGAGQQIPGYIEGTSWSIGDNNSATTRKLYTEPASGTTLLDLGVSQAATLATDLGVAVGDAPELIRWMRGQDVDDEDVDGEIDDVRPWLLGAPLHSRPLPINYGARGSYTQSNPDIRILMGAEDGMMHMFTNTSSGGVESGVESWAFMPRSVMTHMQDLRENLSTTDHPYTVDGAASTYIVDTDADGTIGEDSSGNPDATDKVYAFFGLRRGGYGYYALNVTDPDNPGYLWSIEQDGGDFAELGLTFSSPRVGTVQFGATPTPVLIFGGGYDENKDSANSNDSVGNAVFIVNAETGDLIWKVTSGAVTGSVSSEEYNHVGMIDSIPSDLAALDTDADGNIDRLYVGDMGGTIWRVDLPSSTTTDNRDDWFASELANLGMDDISPADDDNDRRFFHRPDVVFSADDSGAFDAVIIGSGNREDPKETDADNWFYMIKDRNVTTGTVTGTARNHNDYHASTNVNGLGDITDTCINDDACTADLSNGWKLQLEATGEKALAPALTAFGSIFFTTFLPEGTTAEAGTSCAPSEGSGRLYAVNIHTGAPVNNYDASDGSDVELVKNDRFDPLSSGGIPAEVVPVGDFILPPDLELQPNGGRAFWKTFWYEKDVD